MCVADFAYLLCVIPFQLMFRILNVLVSNFVLYILFKFVPLTNAFVLNEDIIPFFCNQIGSL